jgi:hypothetical protein
MEIEITALASMTNARFSESPISYSPRSKANGKKIRFTDGLWAIYYIVYYNTVVRWFSSTRQYVKSVNAALTRITIDDADWATMIAAKVGEEREFRRHGGEV